MDPRVSAALSARIVGHLDPWFVQILDEVADGLRRLFRTRNRLTLAVSGTGSAGMEAALTNLLEPGDKAVIGLNGYFGNRMADMAERCGAEVIPVRAEWGEVITPGQLAEALNGVRPKVVALVHGETSTGVLQPVPELVTLAHDAGALVILDTVTSLGGCEVPLDAWGVDVSYSGTQKCLSCPPGLAPVSFNDRALAAIQARQTKVQSWYLDVTLLGSYWGQSRVYHHTAPISMVYGLHQALEALFDEGLAARIERHAHVSRALWAGLQAMGLRLHVPEGNRLPPLTTVLVPEGVDEAHVRGKLLNERGIEIGGGLGDLKGKVWRIGLMGHGARTENVLCVVRALAAELNGAGFSCSETEAVAAVESAISIS